MLLNNYLLQKELTKKGITKALVKHLLRNFTVWQSHFNIKLRCSFYYRTESKPEVTAFDSRKNAFFLTIFLKKTSIKTQKSFDRLGKKYLLRSTGKEFSTGPDRPFAVTGYNSGIMLIYTCHCFTFFIAIIW